ncbi:MAG: class I SAM-dependent methyltransferase [Oscillospiraceae bacterium]|nr:class I SAM-dependent methyltransferase [Oscillospiraceae bacterium]MBR2890157.1 class I SAM-dependent methyltransferase [Oscillospiraceae bacterium]
MNEVNQTLYIPLYGKALVSRKGIILKDSMAEQIWQAEGFPLRGKSASRWLAYYMGMRSAVIDRWTEAQMTLDPEAVVLHLGCGMDSRAFRLEGRGAWYDVDFPAVISERRRYYREKDGYRMIPGDLRRREWIQALPRGRAIVVMEGLSMYLRPEELRALLALLKGHFDHVCLLMDCYSEFAAKASRFRNPINDVGVTQVWGLDDPEALARDTGITYLSEHSMTPEELIAQLKPWEQGVFRKLYAGKFAGKLYRLYEFES